MDKNRKDCLLRSVEIIAAEVEYLSKKRLDNRDRELWEMTLRSLRIDADILNTCVAQIEVT